MKQFLINTPLKFEWKANKGTKTKEQLQVSLQNPTAIVNISDFDIDDDGQIVFTWAVADQKIGGKYDIVLTDTSGNVLDRGAAVDLIPNGYMNDMGTTGNLSVAPDYGGGYSPAPTPTPGGGATNHIRSSKSWKELPWRGSGDEEYDSIEGAAAAAGVSVEEFQQLLSGDVPMFSTLPGDPGEENIVTHLHSMNEEIDGDDVYIGVYYYGLWYDGIIDQYWYNFTYDKYDGTETWTVARFGAGS